MIVAFPGSARKFQLTRSRLNALAGLCVLLFIVSGLYLYRFREPAPEEFDFHHHSAPVHPIDHLVNAANEQWRILLGRETKSLPNAAVQYRRSRGRHPPPGFAEWYAFAKDKDALIIEELFDQIYHDLSPYWGTEPQELRRQASGFEPRIIVRNQTVLPMGGTPAGWMGQWLGLLRTVEQYLPDLDMPLNGMDEPRVIVPWEDLAQHVEKDHSGRRILDPRQVLSEYMALPDPAKDEPEPYGIKFTNGDGKPYWYLARVACPPDSPSRNSDIANMDFANPPPELYNYIRLSQDGYIKNWTLAKDPCIRPEFQALHGSFVAPTSISTTHQLFPLFGGSKLPINNGILIPPAVYWGDDKLFTGGGNHGGEWVDKQDVFFWRGLASGGRNTKETWTRFQRHRLMSMLNATSVATALSSSEHSFVNFRLPDFEYYHLESGRSGELSTLLADHADARATGLACSPPDTNPHCPYTDPFFEITPMVPMTSNYENKYLPDIDGNSFSGRYRAFLLSTSLPIKSTIYNEWHDSRLIPWAHFIPMDTTFMDFYGIMDYLLAHDATAKAVAMNGKRWAEAVLRKEDMEVYMYRLLLEYARICDDRREFLGYADDLR